LPRGFDSVVLLRRALTIGIAFAPGQLFCTDGSPNRCLRLNMGTQLTDRTERDIDALGQLISEELAAEHRVA
jgi:DNA-binding transcriptional MocR family regulator